MFAIDRVKALAAKNPEWKKKQPFKAVQDFCRFWRPPIPA
jgi:hypothetical protein